MTHIWPQGPRQSCWASVWLPGFCCPEPWGSEDPGRPQALSAVSVGWLLVRGGLPHLSCYLRVFGKILDTDGTHSSIALCCSLAQSHATVKCFPKPSFCSSFRAHPRMAGNPLISGSKTSTSIMNARDLSSNPRPESVPLSSSPLRLPEMRLPQVPAALCQEVALPEASFFLKSCWVHKCFRE